jgi:hypothetical protein
MKIAITAPVYVANEEHKKYLDLTTKSIHSQKHQIVWLPCENYVNEKFSPLKYLFTQQPIESQVLYPVGKQSVAQAWNKGIAEGRKAGCEYILVINTDLILKSNAIDRIVDFAEKHQEAVFWTLNEYNNLEALENAPDEEVIERNLCFSGFLVKKTFFDHVGCFDENFVPAYHEDADMHARFQLADLLSYQYHGARFFHFGSQTIKSDVDLQRKNDRTHAKCRIYFLEKWGCDQITDYNLMKGNYYDHPYNEADKPLSYWRKPKEKPFRDHFPLAIQFLYVKLMNWTKHTKNKLRRN